MCEYPTRIDLCDGKYTLIYDFSTGRSECLRHGEPWRQLAGDKMVLACFDEIVGLRQQVELLKTTPAEKRQDLHCVASDLAQQVRDAQAETEELRRVAKDLYDQLRLTTINLQKGMSRSMQQAQAKANYEALGRGHKILEEKSNA